MRLYFRLKFISWYGDDLKRMILRDRIPDLWHFETDLNPWIRTLDFELNPRKRGFLSKFSGSTLPHSLYKRARLFTIKRNDNLRNIFQATKSQSKIYKQVRQWFKKNDIVRPCSGSVTYWDGSGSLDPDTGFRIRIQEKDVFFLVFRLHSPAFPSQQSSTLHFQKVR